MTIEIEDGIPLSKRNGGKKPNKNYDKLLKMKPGQSIFVGLGKAPFKVTSLRWRQAAKNRDVPVAIRKAKNENNAIGIRIWRKENTKST